MVLYPQILEHGEGLLALLDYRDERIADLMGGRTHAYRADPRVGKVDASGVTEVAIFRSINRTGRFWGNGMTAKVLWEVVRDAASKAGIAKLAPHDLRRTCAAKHRYTISQ